MKKWETTFETNVLNSKTIYVKLLTQEIPIFKKLVFSVLKLDYLKREYWKYHKICFH